MGKVTKVKGKLVGRDGNEIEAANVDVYSIVADTYSELISEIDNIGAHNLRWCNAGRRWPSGAINTTEGLCWLYSRDMGFEGLPRKMNRKWWAALRSGPN